MNRERAIDQEAFDAVISCLAASGESNPRVVERAVQFVTQMTDNEKEDGVLPIPGGLVNEVAAVILALSEASEMKVEQDVAELDRVCSETRVKLSASMIGVGLLDNPDGESNVEHLYGLGKFRTQSTQFSIAVHSEGMVSGSLGNTVVVLMPVTRDRQSTQKSIMELDAVLDRLGLGMSVVIDFSSKPVLDAFSAGVLVGLKAQYERKGIALHLSWLRCDDENKSIVMSLVKPFNLQMKCGYYFSSL